MIQVGGTKQTGYRPRHVLEASRDIADIFSKIFRSSERLHKWEKCSWSQVGVPSDERDTSDITPQASTAPLRYLNSLSACYIGSRFKLVAKHQD